MPTVTINGTLTQLSSPAYLTLDTSNDRMYVPNAGNNSIAIFDTVSQASQNIPPTRQISGANTQLNQPVQIELDSTNNLLYVANAGNSSVAVFANATTATGNVAPTRVLSGTGTLITSISSIHLDTANDRLWVVDPAAGALLVFQPASTLNGSPPPVRTVSGSNTDLLSPQFMLQTGQTLFVSCAASIVRFSGADALSGNIAPATVLTGANTGLVTPEQLVYNSGADELSVADSGASAVLVFASASTATQNPFPARSLTGANTGFSGLTGLALDLSR